MGYGGMGNMGNGMQDGMGWGQGAAGRWNQGNMSYDRVGNGGGYYSASSTSGGYSHQQFHENQFTAQQYHDHFQDGRSRQPFPPGGNNRGSIASVGSAGVGEVVGPGAGAGAGTSDDGQQLGQESQNQQNPLENAPPSAQEQSSDVPGAGGSVEPQTNGHPAPAADTVGDSTAVTVAETDDEAGRESNDNTTVPAAELPISNMPPGSATNGNEFYHQTYMNYPMGQYHGMNPNMNPNMINSTTNNSGGYRGNFNGGFRGGRGGHWSDMNGNAPTTVKSPGQGLGVEGAPTGPKALREGFRGGRGGIRGGFGARGGMRGGYAGSAWSRRFVNNYMIITRIY